jgi:flagellar motility protein MotE (MotC chaperone)
MSKTKRILIFSAGVIVLLSLVWARTAPATLESKGVGGLAEETEKTSKDVVRLATELKEMVKECSCASGEVESRCAGQCCDCVGEVCPNRGAIESKQKEIEELVKKLKNLTKDLWREVEILEKTKRDLEPREEVLKLIYRVEKMSRLAFFQATYAQLMADLPEQCGPRVPNENRNERCVCACYDGVVEFSCQGEACPNDRFKRVLEEKIEKADKEIEDTLEIIQSLLGLIS